MTIDGILKILRARIETEGSQMAVARNLGVSTQYLSDVLRRQREPGEKILEPLGLKRQVFYVEAR